jgi:hypothetical protein
VFTIIILTKGDEYKCSYTDGGGKQYDEGIWKVKISTPKSLVLEKISEKEIWDFYEKGEIIKCSKNSHSPLFDNEDGTFTIYPNQNGTPFYFEIER